MAVHSLQQAGRYRYLAKRRVDFSEESVTFDVFYPLFKCSGLIECSVFGVCKQALTVTIGTGELRLGIRGRATLFIADTTHVNLNNIRVWVDTSPTLEAEALPAKMALKLGTIAWYKPTSAYAQPLIGIRNTVSIITGGIIDFYCLWSPGHPGAYVTNEPFNSTTT